MSSKTKREMVDGYVTYIMIAKISMPFTQWKAFKLKIIDKNGNQIREPSTAEERDAWGYFDRLVANLKKQLLKVPGGAQVTSNFYMATRSLVGGGDPRKIEAELRSYKGQAQNYLANIQEDAIPANAVGDASSMAGLDNNPPVKRTKLAKRIITQMKKEK